MALEAPLNGALDQFLTRYDHIFPYFEPANLPIRGRLEVAYFEQHVLLG